MSEVTFRLFDFCACKINPKIKDLGDKPPWFYSGVETGKEKREDNIPTISPLLWNINRAKFFLDLDDDDKRLFSECFRLTIFYRLKGEENFHSPYNLSPHFNVVNELSQLHYETVEDSVEAYYASEYQLGEFFLCDFFAMRSYNGEVVWYRERENRSDDNSPWEVQYVEYKKNFRMPGYEFRTNNVGFRDDGVVIPKPLGIFRIVAIGGSTTLEGPTSEETYPNFLETSLNEKFRDVCRVEVINAGVPGITWNKIWMRVPDYLMLQPDLIILSEGVNDITHILIPYWLGRLPSMKRLLSYSDLIVRFLPFYFLPSEKCMKNDMEKMTFTYIQKVASYLHKRGILVVLTDMPSPNYTKMCFNERSYIQYVTRKWWGGRLVDYRMYEEVLKMYNSYLRNWSKREGIPLVELSEIFWEESPSIFVDLCHLKLDGIRRKADIIIEFIEKEKLIDCSR